MSEEKELQESEFDEVSELSDFVEFSDLGEFATASSTDILGELGDIDDLGDISDLSEEVPVSDSADSAEAIADELSMSGELSDIDVPVSEMTEEVPDIDVPMPEMTEEVPDIDVPIPEMTEEVPDIDVPMPEMTEEVPGIDVLMPEMTEEVSDIDVPMPEMAEEVPDIDMSMPEMTEEVLDTAIPELDGGDFLSDLNDEISFDTVEPSADVPDIFETANEPELFTEGDQGLEMSDDIALEDTVEESVSIEDAEASVEDALHVLEESDVGSMDNDFLGGMDLDLSAGEEMMEETPMAMDESSESGLDSMLGGILGNLDMGGSTDESAAAEDVSMDDILGLDDNPFGSEDGADNGLDDMLDVAGMIPEENSAEEEKPGLLKKVFGNVITDEIAEAERLAAKQEEEDAAKKAEEDAKAKEEAEVKKAEKKAEKEAKKAEKQKEKEAKKAEKAAQKAEKKAKREEEEATELEVVGKLNKVGVSIIVIATALFLVFEIAGTNLFSYASTKKKAVNYFEMGKYTDAYKEAIGTDMREKDEETYNKIKVVMKVQQSLNTYQNYDRINYYPEALDALLRGIKRYDANIEEATELEVDDDMMSCRRQILTLLQEEFNLSESEAYALLALDKEEYQERVIELGLKKKL